jgi:hypothetical protein
VCNGPSRRTEERASAIEALADLLVVRGASDEAALLRGQAAELERRRAELTGGTVRNVGPKVGRNDPTDRQGGGRFNGVQEVETIQRVPGLADIPQGLPTSAQP